MRTLLLAWWFTWFTAYGAFRVGPFPLHAQCNREQTKASEHFIMAAYVGGCWKAKDNE